MGNMLINVNSEGLIVSNDIVTKFKPIFPPIRNGYRSKLVFSDSKIGSFDAVGETYVD